MVATPGLAQALTTGRPKINSKSQYKGKIANALIDVLDTYMVARSKQHIVSRSLDSSLRNFLATFGTFFEPFAYVEYQDVHEFLSCLLLSVNEDLNTADKFNKPLDKNFVNTNQTKVDPASYYKSAKS